MKNTLKYGYKQTLQERFKKWTSITNANYNSTRFNKNCFTCFFLNCAYTADAILSGSGPHREQSHNWSN